MVHKGLQADIVGENRLGSLRDATVAAGSVRRARVKFGEQETSLGSAGVANDETRKRETVLDEVLGWGLVSRIV